MEKSIQTKKSGPNPKVCTIEGLHNMHITVPQCGFHTEETTNAEERTERMTQN